MALIEFSTPKKTHVEFSFFDHNSARSVKYAIDRIGYDRGITAFADPEAGGRGSGPIPAAEKSQKYRFS